MNDMRSNYILFGIGGPTNFPEYSTIGLVYYIYIYKMQRSVVVFFFGLHELLGKIITKDIFSMRGSVVYIYIFANLQIYK